MQTIVIFDHCPTVPNREFPTLVKLRSCAEMVALLLLMLFSVSHADESTDDNDAVMDFFKGEPDTGYPATSPLLVNANGRDYQSLNGRWNIIVDEAGMSWRVITEADYFDEETVYPATGMKLLEHSFDSQNQLTVPGDWNSQIPELDRYRSRVLYQREVNIEPVPGKLYFLHFGGANYTTDLFVNDQLVGRHVGGYTAFNFDITEFIKPGKNSIIARVDAHLDETTVPTMRTSDFWKYGGLTRDVGLVTLPSTYIAQYHLYLHDITSGEIRGWVQLSGESVAEREVKLDIDKAGVSLRVKSDNKGRAEIRVKVKDLKLWSPQSPKLYHVALSLDGETVSDRIGFRTVSTDGLKILLNGKPMSIRGISMHEETVLNPGLSNSREDVQAQFKLVKELNANFVRLAHYPHNEHTLKLADEMGLMVWSEVPIVSLIDWDNPETLAAAKSQVAENIIRDMNRASIVMWSISNESFPQTRARLDFLSELATTARALDESNRPIASALVGSQREEFAEIGKHLLAYLLRKSDLDPTIRKRLMAMAAGGNGPSAAHSRIARTLGGLAQNGGNLGDTINVVIHDPLGEVVDIVGYNEYFGWYYSKNLAKALGIDEGLMREAMLGIMPKIRFSNSFGKPMIISEFGAGAKQGLHSKDALLWSEEYQAKVYRAQLHMLAKSPYVQGFSPWVLKDFRSHLRELNGIQDTYNRKGLVSEVGKKKKAFYVLKNYYEQQSADSLVKTEAH